MIPVPLGTKLPHSVLQIHGRREGIPPAPLLALVGGLLRGVAGRRAVVPREEGRRWREEGSIRDDGLPVMLLLLLLLLRRRGPRRWLCGVVTCGSGGGMIRWW